MTKKPISDLIEEVTEWLESWFVESDVIEILSIHTDKDIVELYNHIKGKHYKYIGAGFFEEIQD